MRHRPEEIISTGAIPRMNGRYLPVEEHTGGPAPRRLSLPVLVLVAAVLLSALAVALVVAFNVSRPPTPEFVPRTAATSKGNPS